MSIFMQKYLSTPVHEGARQVALMAYRSAGTPDDSELPQGEKLKAILAVYNAVHATVKGPIDSAAAEAGRLWDTALSGQQKRMIAATPAAAPTIVAEAIKRDQELRQKVPTPAARSDAELAAEAAFYDVRGNSRFDRLGAGSAVALFRRSDYGSMSSQWDPKTGVLGLTPANFGSTEFSRAGLDLATTQHLFRLGFSAPAILQATSLTRDLGIGIKENVAAVARLKRDVKGIEPSLRTVKSLTDEVNAEDKSAREAHARGDSAAGAEHQRRADEARQKRQKLVDEERDRIKRERPDKPGLVQDFDATVKAITRREVQIDADLKAGRITQQQADEKQAILRDRRSNSLVDEVRVQVHAERAAGRDPQASSPARARATEEIKAAEVQPKGRAAANAGFADAFDSGATVAAADAREAKPIAAEPSRQMADAGEKAKTAAPERTNTDPGQAQSAKKKPAPTMTV